MTLGGDMVLHEKLTFRPLQLTRSTNFNATLNWNFSVDLVRKSLKEGGAEASPGLI